MPTAAATALLCLLAVALRDRLVLQDGAVRDDVVVTEESAALTTFVPAGGGVPRTLPTPQVREVVRERSSDAYRAAGAFEAAGRFDDAACLFLAAARAPPPAFDWEAQYGAFRAAECRRLEGRDDEAARLYGELLEHRPQTRFRGDCLDRLARLSARRGDLAGARARLEILRRDAVERGLGRRWQLRAELLLLQLDEPADATEALRSYVAFETRAADFPDVRNLARLRAGRLRLAAGQVERARAFFAAAFAEREALEPEIAAGASNGLALCLLAANPDESARGEALLDFLRTVDLYGPRLGRDPILAEALVEAARALLATGAPRDRERARALIARCRDQFAGTTFAQQAARLR